MNEVLYPSEVGVAFRWHAIRPPNVIILAIPVTIIERRIGNYVVGLEIGM